MLIADFVHKEFTRKIQQNVGLYGFDSLTTDIQQITWNMIMECTTQYHDNIKYTIISTNTNYSRKLQKKEIFNENEYIFDLRWIRVHIFEIPSCVILFTKMDGNDEQTIKPYLIDVCNQIIVIHQSYSGRQPLIKIIIFQDSIQSENINRYILNTLQITNGIHVEDVIFIRLNNLDKLKIELLSIEKDIYNRSSIFYKNEITALKTKKDYMDECTKTYLFRYHYKLAFYYYLRYDYNMALKNFVMSYKTLIPFKRIYDNEEYRLFSTSISYKIYSMCHMLNLALDAIQHLEQQIVLFPRNNLKPFGGNLQIYDKWLASQYSMIADIVDDCVTKRKLLNIHIRNPGLYYLESCRLLLKCPERELYKEELVAMLNKSVDYFKMFKWDRCLTVVDLMYAEHKFLYDNINYSHQNIINLYMKLPQIRWNVICRNILIHLAVDAILESNYLQFFSSIISLLITSISSQYMGVYTDIYNNVCGCVVGQNQCPTTNDSNVIDTLLGTRYLSFDTNNCVPSMNPHNIITNITHLSPLPDMEIIMDNILPFVGCNYRFIRGTQFHHSPIEFSLSLYSNVSVPIQFKILNVIANVPIFNVLINKYNYCSTSSNRSNINIGLDSDIFIVDPLSIATFSMEFSISFNNQTSDCEWSKFVKIDKIEILLILPATTTIKAIWNFSDKLVSPKNLLHTMAYFNSRYNIDGLSSLSKLTIPMHCMIETPSVPIHIDIKNGWNGAHKQTTTNCMLFYSYFVNNIKLVIKNESQFVLDSIICNTFISDSQGLQIDNCMTFNESQQPNIQLTTQISPSNEVLVEMTLLAYEPGDYLINVDVVYRAVVEQKISTYPIYYNHSKNSEFFIIIQSPIQCTFKTYSPMMYRRDFYSEENLIMMNVESFFIPSNLQILSLQIDNKDDTNTCQIMDDSYDQYELQFMETITIPIKLDLCMEKYRTNNTTVASLITFLVNICHTNDHKNNINDDILISIPLPTLNIIMAPFSLKIISLDTSPTYESGTFHDIILSIGNKLDRSIKIDYAITNENNVVLKGHTEQCVQIESYNVTEISLQIKFKNKGFVSFPIFKKFLMENEDNTTINESNFINFSLLANSMIPQQLFVQANNTSNLS